MTFRSLKTFVCAALVWGVVVVDAVGDPKYEYIDENDIPELKYMNPDADPCDNFYEYTCGNFRKYNPIPEGKYNWDHFTILQDEVHQLLRVILESGRKTEDPVALQKAKAAYTACLNVNYEDRLALPELQVMREMGSWPLLHSRSFHVSEFSWGKVGDVVAKYGVPMFFNYEIIPNYFNANENSIYIYRDALSNPATIRPTLYKSYEEYLEESMRLTRDTAPIPFENFLRTIAFRLRDEVGTFKNDDDIIADIQETIEFMRYLQGGGIITGDDVFDNIPTSTTIANLQAWTDKHFGEDLGLNWVEYFNRVFGESGVVVTNDMKVIIERTDLIYGVINLVRKANARILTNFMMVRLFTYMAPDSDEQMRQAFDTYYANQKYDVFPRWEYCLRKILGYSGNVEFSMALTYEYQRYHFNVNRLQAAADMIKDLRSAFQDILYEAEWIDDETRANALKKAEAMITLLGYPDYAEDRGLLDEYYTDLDVCTWDHFGNSQRARAFRQANNFDEIDNPRNRELWSLSPLEVNAFYNRVNNRMLIPVSILNPVFFSGNISVLDYGRIGAIIGHEITHGFDNQGRIYNEEGSVINPGWWTAEALASFMERAQCFLEQYSNYFIEEIGQYVNATSTLNENLADNGGLRQAYKAFQKLKQRSSKIKTVKDFTPEQLFFVGFGTMWCMAETDYYLEQIHTKNVYSPGRYRVIGSVSNMREFAEAFNCPVGSRMNPVDKCVLW